MANALTLAIVGHLFGDYLLQNDWMALHKKQSAFRCAVHCAIWTLAVCVAASWWSPLVIALLFVTHFAQDHTNVVAWWMDTVGQKQFRTGPCAPWSSIVVDNVWHILALTLIARWIA
jgi:hypothetical protein